MKQWLRWLIHLISLTLFLLILWWGGVDAWRQIWAGDRTALLLAFGLHGCATIFSASRLKLVTEDMEKRRLASWRQFYHLNMMARALGIVLPRGLSAVGGKAVALRALGVPLQRSVWLVMVDNLLDVALLAVMTLPAFFYMQGWLGEWGLATAVLLLIGPFMALVWWGSGAQRLTFLRRWVARWPWLANKVLVEGGGGQWVPTPSTAVQAILWSIGVNGVLILSFYFIGQAIDLPASWWLFLASYPFVQLSLIVALAPGGLGIFDLGWLGLLRLGGVDGEMAVTFVVAQRTYVYAFILLLAGISLVQSLFLQERV